jgi:pyruvate kinase
LIIVLTDTGLIARLVAKYRPPVHILACSVVSSVVKNLNTTRGVLGYKIPSYQGQAEVIKVVTDAAKQQGLVKSGGKVICILSHNEETPDESNILKIVDIE